MAKRRKRMYLASSSETRPPYFRKNHGVTKGRTAKTATETTTKISVLMVNGEKINPNAITVPRSLMKQAARMDLPYSATLKPSSSITAYTTATEVVERATPQSQLDMIDQCSTKCAIAVQPRNGPKNPASPMTDASRHFVLKITGSSSAPARNVSTMAPVPARNAIHCVLPSSPPCARNTPMISWATVPATISESA